MVKKQHSLGLQALNQARTATHAGDFYAGYLALVVEQPSLSAAFHAYGDFFSLARKAMREMAVINAASVLDSQTTSTGMIGLIADVRTKQSELKQLCDDLENRLNIHRPAFSKAAQIRSNIIAHRSKQLTYKEVYDKVGLADDELAKAIEAWRAAAQELSLRTCGQHWQPTADAGGAARKLLQDIASGIVRP